MARILVVEDNPTNLDLMVFLLKSFGHEVIIGRDGVEGIDAARRHHPDLVLMDIHMPRMDGLEAVQLLKADPILKPLPIIAVSALAMVGDRERILAAGFDGYVSKPIEPADFVQLVETFVNPRTKARIPLPSVAQGENTSILVVEDDPATQQFLMTLLSSQGYRVTLLSDGEAALQSARLNRPDLIIVDLVLPNMDGYEFLARLRADPETQNIRVIVHTASYYDDPAKSLATSAGASEILIKPVEPVVLLAAVQRALGLAPQPLHISADDFERDHVRLVTRKLYEKVTELEAANAELRRLLAQLRQEASERVRTESALSESQGKFERVFRSSPDSIVIATLSDGRYIDVNDGFTTLTGYTRQEVVGRTVADLNVWVNPEDRARMLQALEKGQLRDFEFEFRHKSGEIRVGQRSAEIIRLGSETCVIGITRDITDRKRIEKALRESEMRFHLAAQATNDVLWDWNLPSDAMWWSASMQRVLGYVPAEIGGDPAWWRDHIAPEDRNRVWSKLSAFLKSEDTIWEDEYHLLRADGSFCAISDRGVVLRDGKGVALRMVGGLRDVSQRKRSEFQQRLQAAALEAAANAIVITDVHGEIRWVNPAFTKLTGYSFEEARGKNPRILNSGAHQREFFENLWNTVLAGQVWQGGMVNRRKDGTVYYEDQIITPVKNEAGAVTHFIAIKQDITERRRAAEALRSSESKFRALTETAAAAILITRDDRFLYANRQAEIICGCSREELMARSFWDFVHPDDAGLVRDRRARRAAGASVTPRYEFRMVRTNGEVRWIDFSVAIIDYEGAPAFLGTAVDITERNEAEEKLRRSESRHRELIDNAVLGIWLTTPAGELLYANAAMISMLGYESLAELQQIRVSDSVYVNPADRARLEGMMLREGSVRGFDSIWKKKDGGLLNVRLGGRLVRKANGDTDFMEVIAEDTTERLVLEEQLRQAQKMEAVGQLAGGVAHDFNNLLGVILGYGELLKDSISSPAEQEALSEMLNASTRASELTKQLLAFSRKQIFSAANLDLNELLSSLFKMLRRLLPENIELRIQPGANLGQIHADRSQIEQVILNLVVNARDAMPTGGVLMLETSLVHIGDDYLEKRPIAKRGPHVMLAVTDTGEGMSPETQAHIFEPFFTTKSIGKGTGLGLATVYGIVKQSQGFIWVYSEPAKGTTFKVYLPQVERQTSRASASDEEIRGGTETILVVEDVSSLRTLFVNSLAVVGYHVLAAENAAAALETAEKHDGPIQALVTDVVMPGLSGSALAQKLQAKHPQMRVLYVTGYTDDAIVHHGVLQEGVDLLQKPFGPADLQRKVRMILDRQ